MTAGRRAKGEARRGRNTCGFRAGATRPFVRQTTEGESTQGETGLRCLFRKALSSVGSDCPGNDWHQLSLHT
jgi:hypothetical protein